MYKLTNTIKLVTHRGIPAWMVVTVRVTDDSIEILQDNQKLYSGDYPTFSLRGVVLERYVPMKNNFVDCFKLELAPRFAYAFHSIDDFVDTEKRYAEIPVYIQVTASKRLRLSNTGEVYAERIELSAYNNVNVMSDNIRGQWLNLRKLIVLLDSKLEEAKS